MERQKRLTSAGSSRRNDEDWPVIGEQRIEFDDEPFFNLREVAPKLCNKHPNSSQRRNRRVGARSHSRTSNGAKQCPSAGKDTDGFPQDSPGVSFLSDYLNISNHSRRCSGVTNRTGATSIAQMESTPRKVDSSLRLVSKHRKSSNSSSSLTRSSRRGNIQSPQKHMDKPTWDLADPSSWRKDPTPTSPRINNPCRRQEESPRTPVSSVSSRLGTSPRSPGGRPCYVMGRRERAKREAESRSRRDCVADSIACLILEADENEIGRKKIRTAEGKLELKDGRARIVFELGMILST